MTQTIPVVIRSAHNPLFKHCLKLATRRRERLKHHQTLLDGEHLIDTAQRADIEISKLIIAESKASSWSSVTSSPIVYLADALFAQLSELESISGMIAMVTLPKEAPVRTDGFCLLLDGVQDPGNVGSILRSAAAAGVDQVLLSAQCADVWSPRVLRAAQGAQFCLSVLERADLLDFATHFRGPLVATLPKAKMHYFQAELLGTIAIVVGSEGQGISEHLQYRCQRQIGIPMPAQVESLNVAVATAICLFERVRQHLCE